jgi:hypothetical protein
VKNNSATHADHKWIALRLRVFAHARKHAGRTWIALRLRVLHTHARTQAAMDCIAPASFAHALLKHWPQDFPGPDETTLWRRPTRAVRDGRVLREGTGRKNGPYRYCLPEKAEAWRADPIHPDNLAAWFKSPEAEIVDEETAEE